MARETFKAKSGYLERHTRGQGLCGAHETSRDLLLECLSSTVWPNIIIVA
jgi:hypothetical protein